MNISDIGWKLSEWQTYANKYNGTVMWMDYGSSGGSCYGYPQLVFCLLMKIAEYLVQFLIQYIPIQFLQNLIFIGYSLGAQMLGIMAQLLQGKQVYVIEFHVLDPAGPCFGTFGVCQSTPNSAKYTVSIRMNLVMGSTNMCLTNATILCNPPSYIGPECFGNPNPICEHMYAPAAYRQLTIGDVPIQTFYTEQYPLVPGTGTTANILITPGQNLMNGYYEWDYNMALPLLG